MEDDGCITSGAAVHVSIATSWVMMLLLRHLQLAAVSLLIARAASAQKPATGWHKPPDTSEPPVLGLASTRSAAPPPPARLLAWRALTGTAAPHECARVRPALCPRTQGGARPPVGTAGVLLGHARRALWRKVL